MSTPTSKDKDYEHLGRLLVEIYESGYQSKSQLFKITFIKGLLSGLGGVLGATIVVALLVWVLSLFGHVPLIGRLVESVQNTLNAQ